MRDFRFGIEEEYFVVDRRTARVKSHLSQPFMKAAKKKLGPSLMYELLQSQIEVATTPVDCSRDALQQLRYSRSSLAELGREFDLGIVAAGTHPLAMPHKQQMTPKRRYAEVAKDLGMVAWGNPLCGLHVHVEVPEPDQRVAIMHRLMPFVPLLLALSTSSPFWAGCDTGLLGYRNAVNDALPRTGFPEMFGSMGEYQAYVDALVEAGTIPDATYVWWALRPSLRHPTIELRLTDCCTAVDDAVAIAALFRALVHHVYCDRKRAPKYSPVVRALTEENRWRAQRYGTGGTFLDLESHEAKPFSVVLNETLELASGGYAEFRMEHEAEHLRTIATRGTSAHLQLELYRSLRKSGRRSNAALQEVTKYLRRCTEAGAFEATQSAHAPTSLSRVISRRTVINRRRKQFIAPSVLLQAHRDMLGCGR